MQQRLNIIGNIFIDVADIFTPLVLIVVWFLLDCALKWLFRRGFKVAAARLCNTTSDDVLRRSLEYRLKTIRQLSTQLARVVLALLMGSWVLGSMGIDVRPVIAGIGVAGLGISLAAQNIIRDYINGFIILIEDQYNVGDWIEINTYSGTVCLFTLRATRLRDIEGNLVIVPNGAVQTVVNYTKEWSVAVIKVGITYEADYAKARKIIEELGKEMVEGQGNIILDAPTFQGITDFSPNAVDMRILIKTLPGQQWAVARSFREKIKERFDAENISFAYPQVVVHTK